MYNTRYSYEIADLVIPDSPYEARGLTIGIITGIAPKKFKVYWLTKDKRCVTLWHVGGELKMISPHEGYHARLAKYRKT